MMLETMLLIVVANATLVLLHGDEIQIHEYLLSFIFHFSVGINSWALNGTFFAIEFFKYTHLPSDHPNSMCTV